MKRAIWGIVLLVLGLAGCSARSNPPSANELLIIPNTQETTSASNSTAAKPSATAVPGTGTDPGAPGGGMESGAKVPKIGVAVRQVVKSATTAAVVVDREQHKTLISENGDRPFISGSLVKVMIALDALHRHPNDQQVARRVYTMIQFSDDDLASGFWGTEGGASIISRVKSMIGLRGTKPPNPTNMWGWTMITANDMARVYDYLLDEAPDQDRETIVGAMANTAEHGSDGFYQHFGIPDGLGGKFQWAVKQAWASDDDTGVKALHSTGFVGKGWRYEVIVLTEEPMGVGLSGVGPAVTTGCKAITAVLS